MQFQVPQFTDIEDKIIGPLTLKQFLYLLVAAVIIFILYKLFSLFVVIVLAIPVVGLTIALAFVTVNNQPFINVIKNFLGFLRKPDFYVWKKPIAKTPREEETPQIIEKTPPGKKTKPITKEKLQEIGWKIEIEK
ncbi:MAG: PrgI family protein [Patescibacteria group bacterium]